MPWAAAAAAASAVLPQAPSSEPCGTSFFCETVPSFLPVGSETLQSMVIGCLPSLLVAHRDLAFDRVGLRRGRFGERHAVARQLTLERQRSDELPSPGAPVTLGTLALIDPTWRCCPSRCCARARVGVYAGCAAGG